MKRTVSHKTLFIGFTFGIVLIACAALTNIISLPLAQQQSSAMIDKQPSDLSQKARLSESFGKMPLYFIENRGQLDSRVDYYVQGRDQALYFSPQGVTFVLTGEREREPDSEAQMHQAMMRGDRQRWTLKLDFIGANPAVKPVGRDQTEAVISYFKGTRDHWQTGLKTYSTIVYSDLWPGIDLVYSGTVNRLKYQFIVKPGADPDQIKLAYRGAEAVKVNKAGQLEVATPVISFRDDKPYSYQDVEAHRREVVTSYELEGNQVAGAQVYGFRVGGYDKSKPLILDPAVLVYCGFIGGSQSDQGNAIAVDAAGNAYVTGYTLSAQTQGFPVTAGPDLSYNGQADAFVAKIKADGTGLVYCGYIGGSGCPTSAAAGVSNTVTAAICDPLGGDDVGVGIAVDSTGNAYIVGVTNSRFSFPLVIGPDLTFADPLNCSVFFCDPGQESFVAKVNPSGTSLVYCGYVGGSKYETVGDIAVDSSGRAYVTGNTLSSQIEGFPVTVGPDVTFNSVGNDNAFVARINADGTGFEYCGYIGAASGGAGIAVDAAGNAYVSGNTSSDQNNFPVTIGPDLTYNGGGDVFVAKVKADGTGLVYCGYIGGSEADFNEDLGIDNAGNVYLSGSTLSNETSFPVTVGPDLTSNGGQDAFVAKVKADGTGLVYCGYVGGANFDRGLGIAVSGAGNAYLTGGTNSDETTFPVILGPDLTFNNPGEFSTDAFVAKVKIDGTVFDFCGYIGGIFGDFGYGIAVDGAGNAYVTGFTDSDQSTFPATMGPDLTINGGTDAFVAKVPAVPCNFSISPTTQTFDANGGSVNVNVTTGSVCNWTAISNNSFTTINSGGSGSGNGVVNFSVAPNTGLNPRTGTMTVAGETFTVRQTGCQFSISLATQTFTASGGSGSVNVTSPGVCNWTAVSNASFITITSGGSGAGNNTVSYSVAANSGAAPRAGTMTIAGKTFTVLQSGVTCAGTISPTNASYSADGGNGGVTVPAPVGCNWTAISNNPWIIVTSGGSGSGNGTVNYSIAANVGSARTGTITIAGQFFTVTQATSGLQYYPLPAPVRLLDTRDGQNACDAPGAPLGNDDVRTQQATVPCTGIPATAKAIVGNATVVNFLSSGSHWITLYPSDAAQPNASNLNFSDNQIVPNAFTVGLGSDGAFKIYSHAVTDFIVDITGYYAPPGQGGLYYHPLPAPVRLLDTRMGETACDAPGLPLGNDAIRTAQASGACSGVPAAAKAIVGNATVVNFLSSGSHWITLYPSNAAQPNASNLNFSDNQIIPNAFTVGLGSDGAFKIYSHAVTDFIVDVAGYFSDEAVDVNGEGLLFNTLPTPVRLLDTRPNQQGCDAPGSPLGNDATLTQSAYRTCFNVTIPNTAKAVVGNATVVNFISSGFHWITLYPFGTSQPNASNLNFTLNQIAPNAFVVGLSNDGKFNIYSHASTHFIVDLTGYFSP